MTDNINEKFDEFMGDWFDNDSSPSIDNSYKPFTQEQIKTAADLRLVHSFLMHLADKDQLAKERRIQKVMHQIDSSPAISAKLYNFAKPFIRYGIAALIIISITILFTRIHSNTALAAFDKIVTAIDFSGDRTYSIRIEGPQNPPPPNISDDRPPQPPEGPERASLDGATLYLRSPNKFVLYWKTPSGRTVINGSDGKTNWHIRPDKPVLVSDNPQAFRIPMPPDLAEILSLDFKSTLLHIRTNYKIKYMEDANSTIQDKSLIYLDASKMDRNSPGPKNIEIWADSQTGLLQRIEFADIHLEEDPSPKRLIIDLVDQKIQSDDWFTHQAHHPADAEVDFISE